MSRDQDIRVDGDQPPRPPDALAALAAFAREWRRQFQIPLIGVTGSNGKTTTKELLGSILSRLGPTLVTRGNLNNHIGVPLMLLELTSEHRYAVIEMGANHLGEIAHLCGIALPTIGIVTNAGAAHLEGFGSLAGVAAGKGELIAALPPDGTAVINADDAYTGQWRDTSTAVRMLTFGFEQPADFAAHKVSASGGATDQSLRRIAADEQFRIRPSALAAAVAEDRAAGHLPIATVATIGTTSSTSVDDVAAVADICARERMWLHVDAAYAGVMAMVPEFSWMRAGLDRADSIVVNPHKWLFTPFDLSVLFTPRMDVIRQAFSLTPEYLKTSEAGTVRNLMDTGIQLGRRFRSLKLWAVLRYFGAEGIRARLLEHLRLARLFASWVDADPAWERSAPVPFSVVCFRWKGTDADNLAILEAVNKSGEEIN